MIRKIIEIFLKISEKETQKMAEKTNNIKRYSGLTGKNFCEMIPEIKERKRIHDAGNFPSLTC